MNKKNVLIVDDDVEWLNSFGELLSLITGIKPFQAGDGDDAYKVLKSVPIDVVFVETNIEKLNGIALLKKIKAEFSNIKVFVFFDGLRGSSISRDEVLALGADRVLTKLEALPQLPKLIKDFLV
jgi:DNA-binding response OmpR family regulator